MMAAKLSELDDFQFRDVWRNFSDQERAALSDEDRRNYIERYNELTPWVKGAGERAARRGNGEVPMEPDPVIEARTSFAESQAVPSADRMKPNHRYLQFKVLAEMQAPPMIWLMDHWLSWHPTLLAGRGGIGKSLLAQQLGTALACGLPTWCAASKPVKVLYWACEDDHDQLWRRQEFICAGLGVSMAEMPGLTIDARQGLENALMSTEFGRPMWTPAIELLRQQVNDLNIEVLLLDNIGHTFGANENVRHDVTLFLNGICGLVEDRPFCPILLGHPSKAVNSEYSGSTAWENAVRMRWYLDDKLPDAKDDPESTPDPDYRVLAKRKTNYTRLDYVPFKFNEGVLVPELYENADPGLMANLRKRRAKSTVISAINKLAEVKLYGNNTSGRYYLPHLILENNLADGLTKEELAVAMRELFMAKTIEMSEFGKNEKRRVISGLKVN